MQFGRLGQVSLLFLAATSTTGDADNRAEAAAFVVGTHMQDAPVGTHTQSADVAQHSAPVCATGVVLAVLEAAVEVQLLGLHEAWLQAALVFLGVSVAKEPTDASKNRADNAAERKFFMVKFEWMMKK